MHINCGLPIDFDGEKLIFKGIPPVASQFRKASELKGVLFDKTCANDEIIYFMYRGLKMPEHAALFQRHLLSYDITIILPKMLGIEFPKTLGHYHSLSKTVSYPEIYEVLGGKAHFLLQKGVDKVEDVVVVEASAGDMVIMPPDYGHVTINPGSEALVMSNLICINVKPDYESINAKGGAAYFETTKGFVRNAAWKPPELRVINANGMKKKFFGSNQMTPSKDDETHRRHPKTTEGRQATWRHIVGSSSNLASSNRKPMYEIFVNEPEKFGFLREPEKHLGELASVLRG